MTRPREGAGGSAGPTPELEVELPVRFGGTFLPGANAAEAGEPLTQMRGVISVVRVIDSALTERSIDVIERSDDTCS